jgi:hypothetical protein
MGKPKEMTAFMQPEGQAFGNQVRGKFWREDNPHLPRSGSRVGRGGADSQCGHITGRHNPAKQ